MIPYTYTYLFGTGIFMIPWIIFYILRKDLRKEMIVMSIFGAIMGFVTSYLWWTIDWWEPVTMTGTRVGIEDILLGFFNGGIAAIAYEVFFKRTYSHVKRRGREKEIVVLIVTMTLLISFLFWIIKLHSFISCVLMLIYGFLFIAILRKDLITPAIINGFFMMLISIPVYLACEFVSSGWIHRMWQFKYLSGILVLGIPIEDLIFYFQFGLFIGPLYKLWHGFMYKQ